MVVGVSVDVVVVVVVARVVDVIFQRHVDALQVCRRVVAEIFPLQEQVDFPECGSLAFVALPALVHQVPNLAGALERSGQADADAAGAARTVLRFVKF